MSAAVEAPAWASEVAWLDKLAPLPSAEEIAGPFINAMVLLHDLAERAQALENPAGAAAEGWEGSDPAHLEQARQYVDTMQRVALLVRLSANSCDHDHGGHVGSDAEAVVRKLSLVDQLGFLVVNVERIGEENKTIPKAY